MTRFQFWCLLLAILALIVAALASAVVRPAALFFALVAAGLALFMYRKARQGRGQK